MQTLSSYLPLVAMLILLGVGLTMLAMRLAHPRLTTYWLLASGGALLAWILIAISGTLSPTSIALTSWQWGNIVVGAPNLLLDRISFPFAFALASLWLAAMLTDTTRYSADSWSTWFSGSMLTTFALLAVLSGDSISLLWSWAALDVFALAIHLIYLRDMDARNHAIIAFSLRSIGIMAYLLGAGGSLYLLLAVFLRLAAIVASPSLTRPGARRESLDVLVKLGSVAVTLILVARLAIVGLQAEWLPTLYLLTAVGGLVAGVVWLTAREASLRFTAWMVGASALCIAAAARGQPLASIAWGVVMILPGAALALYTHRHKWLAWLPFLAALAASGLPFTPAWDVSWLQAPPYSILGLLYLMAQSLLLLGCFRNALRPGEPLPQGEGWIRLVYPLGLLLFPLTHLLTAAWGWRETAKLGADAQSLSLLKPEAWTGALAFALFPIWLFFGWLKKRITARRRVNPPEPKPVSNWWIHPFRLLYHTLADVFRFITGVIEGEGGVLWTVLLLALIIAFFVQGRVGQ